MCQQHRLDVEGDILINLIEGKLIEKCGNVGRGLDWDLVVVFLGCFFFVKKSVWIFWESGIQWKCCWKEGGTMFFTIYFKFLLNFKIILLYPNTLEEILSSLRSFLYRIELPPHAIREINREIFYCSLFTRFSLESLGF